MSRLHLLCHFKNKQQTNLGNEELHKIFALLLYPFTCSSIMKLPTVFYAFITTSNVLLGLTVTAVSSSKMQSRYRLRRTFASVNSNAQPSSQQGNHVSRLPGRAVYDLGIGKNSPVYGPESFDPHTQTKLSTGETTRFMNEYESTRRQPSPLDNVPPDVVCGIQSHGSKSSSAFRKNVAQTCDNGILQPRRVLEDVLLIIDDVGNGRNDEDQERFHVTSDEQPTIVLRDPQMLDMNSVWVELMLHDQKNTMILEATKGGRREAPPDFTTTKVARGASYPISALLP